MQWQGLNFKNNALQTYLEVSVGAFDLLGYFRWEGNFKIIFGVI